MNITTLSYLKTSTGRPSTKMTDKEWQELFKLLKITTTSFNKDSIPISKSCTNTNDRLGISTYHGDTLDQNWRKVLNDNLKHIRNGGHDYVYYIYNISELLKYEQERLKSRYNQKGQYFEIWLENLI